MQSYGMLYTISKNPRLKFSLPKIYKPSLNIFKESAILINSCLNTPFVTINPCSAKNGGSDHLIESSI
jgi:hypothetical protein